MSIPELSIRFRIAVATFTLFVVVAGTAAYVKLPKESNPSIEIPNIVITTIYQGATPDDVERLISQPIEAEIAALSGIEEIRSTSTEGVSTVIVEFTPDVKMEEAKQSVREKVDLARPDLPADAEEPIIAEIDLSDFPVINVNLAAAYSLVRLKAVAEDLQDALEAIPSVLEVGLVGGLEREVQVRVDLERLQAYNLSFNDIINTIRRENTNIPGGAIDVDHLDYLVRVNGQFADPDEIPKLAIVKGGGGGDGPPKESLDQVIYIRDVAEVIFGFKDRKTYARLRVLRERAPDGTLREVGQTDYGQVITLSVKKRSGENILETAAAVREILDAFQFPPDTSVLITGDQSEQVEDLVKDLENNIISGLVFVVLVLVFFLGVRTSLLVGVAIPLSMMVSFAVFLLMDQTLNFIILFSLIIALGMLVDNAIVLVENIYRFIEEGESPFDAARLGAAEVGTAVTASTATTVAAFFPMLFWPGMIGEFMSYMPMTLIITLTCSLFVALVINPVLTGYFARSGEVTTRMSVLTKSLIGLVLVAGAGIFYLANPVTLAVLAVSAVAVVISYVLVIRPIADRFVGQTLPALVNGYRAFVTVTLRRDYTPRFAMLRNTFALGTGAIGLVLGTFGGVVFAAAGLHAALILLIPGGVLLALGVLGIALHSLEVVFVGRWISVIAGLVLAALLAAVVGLLHLSDKTLDPLVLISFAGLPAVIMVFGFLGGIILRHPRNLVLTDNRAKLLTSTLGGLIAIVVVFVIAPTGVEFFPATDPNLITARVTGALGTNLTSSNQLSVSAQKRVDTLLNGDARAESNVKSVLVTVGIGGGDPFGGGGAANARTSQVTMNLARFENRVESSTETMKRLRAEMKGLPGAELEFVQDQQGPPTGPPVNIEVRGPDFSEIVRISTELKARLVQMVDNKKVPEMVDIRDTLSVGRPEMSVRIDRERAAQVGLTTQQIASTLRTAISGTKASTFRDGEDEYDITVQLAEGDRATLESLRNYTIKHEEAQIPLVAVADFDIGSGLGSITRKDQQRVVTVMAGVTTGSNAQEVLTKVKKGLAAYEASLPSGYTLNYTGESEDQKESFAFLTTALMTGAALITMILIAQFNSVYTPLIIMAAVALSMIGVLLGLIMTRTPFGLMTFIGVISLAGIVVNNNIVLIDYMEQLRARGMDKTQAIIEAGATRLRPVLLTAITTVLGLIPLTFGINIDFVGFLAKFEPDFRIGSANTQFWGPMGTTIIAGLVFATFLTLIVVPTMYSALDSLIRRLGQKLAPQPISLDPAIEASPPTVDEQL